VRRRTSRGCPLHPFQMLTPSEIKKCEELVSHWNNEHGSNARTKKLGFRDPEIFGAKCCDLGMWPPRNVRCLGKTRPRLMVVAMCMLRAWRSSRGGGGGGWRREVSG
jgi:hypothetical protein